MERHMTKQQDEIKELRQLIEALQRRVADLENKVTQVDRGQVRVTNYPRG
jgi:hypothetical protein